MLFFESEMVTFFVSSFGINSSGGGSTFSNWLTSNNASRIFSGASSYFKSFFIPPLSFTPISGAKQSYNILSYCKPNSDNIRFYGRAIWAERSGTRYSLLCDVWLNNPVFYFYFRYPFEFLYIICNYTKVS